MEMFYIKNIDLNIMVNLTTSNNGNKDFRSFCNAITCISRKLWRLLEQIMSAVRAFVSSTALWGMKKNDAHFNQIISNIGYQ